MYHIYIKKHIFWNSNELALNWHLKKPSTAMRGDKKKKASKQTNKQKKHSTNTFLAALKIL